LQVHADSFNSEINQPRINAPIIAYTIDAGDDSLSYLVYLSSTCLRIHDGCDLPFETDGAPKRLDVKHCRHVERVWAFETADERENLPLMFLDFVTRSRIFREIRLSVESRRAAIGLLIMVTTGYRMAGNPSASQSFTA